MRVIHHPPFGVVARQRKVIRPSLRLHYPNPWPVGQHAPAAAYRIEQHVADMAALERAYADTHFERLTSQTVQSIETSSLHLDLISDLKRINSHICSIAYPILESAGALSKTRIRHSQLAAMPMDE